MSKARMVILRLIAEGKVTPEEGDRMLRALDENGRSTEEEATPEKSWTEEVAEAIREVAETVRRTVEETVSSAQKVFDEQRPETESVDIGGGSFELLPDARLKAQHAVRLSLGGTSKGSHLVLRTGEGNHVRIVRGQAVEVHRNGPDYVLMWAKGNLELEIPPILKELEVRCIGAISRCWTSRDRCRSRRWEGSFAFDRHARRSGFAPSAETSGFGRLRGIGRGNVTTLPHL